MRNTLGVVITGGAVLLGPGKVGVVITGGALLVGGGRAVTGRVRVVVAAVGLTTRAGAELVARGGCKERGRWFGFAGGGYG